MIPQKMLQWVWGQYLVEDKFVSFESGAEGGYKCKLCAEEIGKRWDTLKMHLHRNHQMPKHRIKIKSLKIPAIKEKCSVCQKPLDPHANKMRRHVESCRGVDIQAQVGDHHHLAGDDQVEDAGHAAGVAGDKRAEVDGHHQLAGDKGNHHGDNLVEVVGHNPAGVAGANLAGVDEQHHL